MTDLLFLTFTSIGILFINIIILGFASIPTFTPIIII